MNAWFLVVTASQREVVIVTGISQTAPVSAEVPLPWMNAANVVVAAFPKAPAIVTETSIWAADAANQDPAVATTYAARP